MFLLNKHYHSYLAHYTCGAKKKKIKPFPGRRNKSLKAPQPKIRINSLALKNWYKYQFSQVIKLCSALVAAGVQEKNIPAK